MHFVFVCFFIWKNEASNVPYFIITLLDCKHSDQRKHAKSLGLVPFRPSMSIIIIIIIVIKWDQVKNLLLLEKQ